MRLLTDLSDMELLGYIKGGYTTAPEIAVMIYPTKSYSEYSFVLAKIRVRLQRMEKRGLIRKAGFKKNSYGTQSRVWMIA